MQAKIVLTERGLKLSSELVVPNDEPAPFLEEARPPKEPIIQGAKLSAMYNTSNGYLDRITLKSAESDRSLKNKPFFLPFPDINQSQYYSILPPFKQGKYPGIYPPKAPASSQSTRREKQAYQQGLQQQQQQTLTVTTQKFTQTLGKLSNTNFSYPLVLDLNNIQKTNGTDIHSKGNTNNNKRSSKLLASPNEQISPLNLIVSPTQLEYQFNGNNNNSNSKTNGFFPFPGNQTDRNHYQSQQMLTTQQKQLLGELAIHKKNDQIQNNNNSFGRNNNIQQQQKQFIPATQRELNETKRLPDKNIYMQNIQERLDLKKAHYFHQREAQDAKLKELAAARINLSKDPVHIAAQYLDELKREDEIVDELMQDVNYFKSRYKTRLAEYHHSRYEKKWNHMQIPHDRPKRNGNSYGNMINNGGARDNEDEGEDEELGTASNRKISTAIGTPNRMPLKSSMKIPSMMKIQSIHQTQTKIQ